MTDAYPAVKRRVKAEWWDEQTRATERRIEAAQARVTAHKATAGRPANILQHLERDKRHRADQRELEAARARLTWLQQHRP